MTAIKRAAKEYGFLWLDIFFDILVDIFVIFFSPIAIPIKIPKTVLKDSGYAVIGIGEGMDGSDGTNRAVIAVENALKSPLLDADLSTAKKALVNVIGGSNLTLREAESIFREVADRINPEAMLKWGARIDEDMKKDSVKVMVVISGVEFPNYAETLGKGVEGNLGVDEV